ncbi:FAD-binding protein, partial [Streptomyces sp. SID10244]|nr:FAD-binding protein [Streptomyces sp. SID10244]
ALDHRYNIGDKLSARKGEPPNERVVQDIEVPIENTTAYVEWFLDTIPIEPIWLCPLRLREPAVIGSDPVRPWPLYPLEPRRTYVNIGFWSAVPVTPGDPGHTNKLIERKVADLDGHKSLYS